MGRILLFDPYSTGHHPVYIERFIRNLCPHGKKHQFTFAVHDKTVELLSEEAKLIAKEHSWHFVELDLKSYQRRRAIFGVSYAERRTLSEFLSLNCYDLIILFYADHIVNSLSFFPLRRTKCVGLFFRAPILEYRNGRFLHRRIERFKIYIRRLLLRSFLRPGSNNKGLFLDFRMAESEKPAFGLCPEPTAAARLTIEEKNEIGKRFPHDNKRITILLAGGITKRKGISKFLGLLMMTASISLKKIRLIIIGEVQDESEGRCVDSLVGEIKEAGGLVVTDFTRVDEKSFSYLFEETDVVVAPYIQHFGPSGVVSQAIRAGKRILATNYGWIGDIVVRYGNGAIYDPTDSAGFLKAFTAVLDGPPENYSSEFREEFVRFNNESNFTKVIMDSVEDLL